MDFIELSQEMSVPQVGLGCMRMHALTEKEASKVIGCAMEEGIAFFDHADIYGEGESERRFAQGRKLLGIPRDKMILQTKCGIHKGFYDLSRDAIVQSVEGSLKRLKTDYLDILLLHRPDALTEPEEVAEAFDLLHTSGKVRYFGVSNHNPGQVEWLKTAVRQPLRVNQLQFSPAHTGLIDCGLDVNMKTEQAVHRDGMVLNYCQYQNMVIQAWSPFQYGQIEGVFFDNPAFADLTGTIRKIASQKMISDSSVVINWILLCPGKVQAIVGTMNPERLAGICRGLEKPLDRKEWYEIYTSAGNPLP